MCKLDVKVVPWRFHGQATTNRLFMTFNEVRHAKNGYDFVDGLKAGERMVYWRVPEWESVIANEGIHSIDDSIWPD